MLTSRQQPYRHFKVTEKPGKVFKFLRYSLKTNEIVWNSYSIYSFLLSTMSGLVVLANVRKFDN
uniref:Uncharacterized protein n=1 Tax=Anguilla anguilla TaxID=7936 RepID=A0A0E9PW41_ANGAN